MPDKFAARASRDEDVISRVLAELRGWAQYSDGEHTEASPQSVSADTRSVLTIDGSSVLNAYAPQQDRRPNPPFWRDDRLWPRDLGEAWVIRTTFTIQPTNNNASLFLEVDIGSDPVGASSIPIFTHSQRLVRGTNPQAISVPMPVYCLETFLQNGAAVVVRCTHSATIWGKSVVLFKIR